MTRSDERGVALVMALLMVLAVSIITSSLLAVARTEAFSSLSYTSMSRSTYPGRRFVSADDTASSRNRSTSQARYSPTRPFRK